MVNIESSLQLLDHQHFPIGGVIIEEFTCSEALSVVYSIWNPPPVTDLSDTNLKVKIKEEVKLYLLLVAAGGT